LGTSKKCFHLCERKNSNMSRIRLQIETVNWFSPKGYDTGCGACYAEE